MSGITSVLLAGVGGQGTILAGNIVAAAALRAGHDVKQSEVHGMAQRGGIVVSQIRFGHRVDSPLIERGTADAVVGFEWSEAVRAAPALRPGATLIADVHRTLPPAGCLDRRSWTPGYPDLDPSGLAGIDLRLADAAGIATEAGQPKAANTVLLGMLSRLLPLPQAAWRAAIEAQAPPRALEANLRCFAAGRRAAPPAVAARPWPASDGPRFRLATRPGWCKGCDICIRLCPERCLTLDGALRVAVLDEDACTGCRLCELLCPDFAIEVAPRPPVAAGA